MRNYILFWAVWSWVNDDPGQAIYGFNFSDTEEDARTVIEGWDPASYSPQGPSKVYLELNKSNLNGVLNAARSLGLFDNPYLVYESPRATWSKKGTPDGNWEDRASL